jgi:hypothetical protein
MEELAIPGLFKAETTLPFPTNPLFFLQKEGYELAYGRLNNII